jgi:hypothetical protein
MPGSPIRYLKPREMPKAIASALVSAGIAASTAALAIALSLSPGSPARAQGIGNIFSDPVPRPPANIPRGNQPPPDEEEEVPVLPQGRVLPAPNRPYPGQSSNMPGPVQSQPLAPPPGTTALPQNAPPPVAVAPPQPGGPQGQPGQSAAVNPALPGLPPGQRQPKGVPQTPASLQPGDEVVQEPPASKIINKKATFSGLDKITGRIINFDEDIGETVQFGALRVKTDACYTRPATEAANTDAFVEVDEITLQGEVKRIFSGWMFAASPGLHGVEHPIYDIWLTDCKGPEQTVVTAAPEVKPTPTPSPTPAAQKRPPAPRPAAPRPSPQQQVQQPPPPPPPPPQQQGGGLFGIFR